MRSYTVGTGFSGIGTPDLAARLLGMTVCWQIEKDDFCQRVLRKNFPTVPNLYGDIYDAHPCYVDVEVFGFPCQPFSIAGKQLAEKDERFLIPEMLRVIDETRPHVVLLENVPRFASLNDGHSFKHLLEALAEMGFDAEWGHLSAADVGAPHQRERWWLVAYSSGTGAGMEEYRDYGRGRQSANSYESAHLRQEHRAAGSDGSNTAGNDAMGYASSERRGTVAPTSNGRLHHGNGNGAPEERQRHQLEPGIDASGELGDADGRRQQQCDAAEWRFPISDERGNCIMGAANHTGWKEHGGSQPVREEQPSAQCTGGQGERAAQPGLGRVIDGDAYRLDGFRPYPARPGEAQYAFEPPRVTSRKDLRPQRLKALGNGMAFDAVYEWLRAIKLWLMEVDGQNAV